MKDLAAMFARPASEGSLLLAAAVVVLGDLVWYELGRRRGLKMLNLICRLTLEPDSCVCGTEGIFARHGGRALLVAKFVPGLNTAAPPIMWPLF